MQKPIVIIGIGQLGGVFARGFLRLGIPVYPVTRSMDIRHAAETYPEPFTVLVAVADDDFSKTLDGIPEKWRHKLSLLQNEMLPGDWENRGIQNPTVLSVWFEKKKRRGVEICRKTNCLKGLRGHLPLTRTTAVAVVRPRPG